MNIIQIVYYPDKGFGRLPDSLRNIAADACDRRIQKDPNDKNALYIKGMLLLSGEDFKYAAECFDKCISIDPTDGDFYFFASMAWFSCGDTLRALEDLRNAVKCNPKDAEALATIGGILLTSDKADSAEAFVDSALGVAPRYTNALYIKYFILLDKKKYRESIAIATNMIKSDSLNSAFYIYRANSYQFMNDHLRAIGDLSKAITIVPRNPIALNNRAWEYMQMGKYNAAIDDCNRSLSQTPCSAHTLDTRGYAYYMLRNDNGALKDLSDAIEFDSFQAIIFYHRGLVYYRMGKHKTAMSDMHFAAKNGCREAREWLKRHK